MSLTGKHILTSSQFTRANLDEIYRLADELSPIARRRETTDVLRGAVLGNLFFEPSTRSRISFGAAFARLGGTVLDTTGTQATSIVKGESLHDTGRVISGYVDIMVIRTPDAGAVAEFARGTRIPVINAGDGAHEHPTQALLDVYTMRNELQRTGRVLDGARIAMVGDLKYGRTVHSLLQLLGMYRELTVTLVSDPSLKMPAEIVSRSRQQGTTLHETADFDAGIAGADIVYMTRVQEERFASREDYERARGKHRLTRELFERVCPGHAVIMHPLPRDSRAASNEIDEDLTQHPRLAIFRQTDSGIPVRMALFAMVLGVEQQAVDSRKPAKWFTPVSFGLDVE